MANGVRFKFWYSDGLGSVNKPLTEKQVADFKKAAPVQLVANMKSAGFFSNGLYQYKPFNMSFVRIKKLPASDIIRFQGWITVDLYGGKAAGLAWLKKNIKAPIDWVFDRYINL